MCLNLKSNKMLREGAPWTTRFPRARSPLTQPVTVIMTFGSRRKQAAVPVSCVASTGCTRAGLADPAAAGATVLAASSCCSLEPLKPFTLKFASPTSSYTSINTHIYISLRLARYHWLTWYIYIYIFVFYLYLCVYVHMFPKNIVVDYTTVNYEHVLYVRKSSTHCRKHFWP